MIHEFKEFGIVKVTLSESWENHKLEVNINWSAIGAQTIKRAREFQNNVSEAVNFANTIESKLKRGSTNDELVELFKS